MGRVILFSGWYSEDLLYHHRGKTFVFGDNLLGFGKGGQAIIRSEKNAFGIPTKRKPSMAPGSFFEEGNDADLTAVLERLATLWTMLEDGETIVFPVNDKGEISLGLERAELKQRAPTIYETIALHVKEMGDSFGTEEAASAEDL